MKIEIILGIAMLTCVIILFGLLFIAVSNNEAQHEKYIAVCTEAKGKVVWNGKYWECFK